MSASGRELWQRMGINSRRMVWRVWAFTNGNSCVVFMLCLLLCACLHVCRRWKDSKLKEDPTWTLEKEMAKKRGVEYVPPAPKVGVGAWASFNPQQ